MTLKELLQRGKVRIHPTPKAKGSMAAWMQDKTLEARVTPHTCSQVRWAMTGQPCRLPKFYFSFQGLAPHCLLTQTSRGEWQPPLDAY